MSFEYLGSLTWGRLPALEQLVLLRLADRANRDGICWPGIDSLARDCQLSRRKVMLCIKALAAKGFIEKLMLPGQKNWYRLLPPPTMLSMAGGAQRARVHGVHGCTDEEANGQLALPNLDAKITLEVSKVVKNLSEEPVRDRARAREDPGEPLSRRFLRKVAHGRGH